MRREVEEKGTNAVIAVLLILMRIAGLTSVKG